jgi:hypothetical protein
MRSGKFVPMTTFALLLETYLPWKFQEFSLSRFLETPERGGVPLTRYFAGQVFNMGFFRVGQIWMCYSMQNFILYKTAYLVLIFVLRIIRRLLYTFELTVQFMSSHVDVSILFLRRTISCTEKISIYKNQIILNMLNASKLADKKLCNSVTENVTLLHLFFAFFIWKKNSLERIFFTVLKTVRSPTKLAPENFPLRKYFCKKLEYLLSYSKQCHYFLCFFRDISNGWPLTFDL